MVALWALRPQNTANYRNKLYIVALSLYDARYLVVLSALDETGLDGRLPHEVLRWSRTTHRNRQHPHHVFGSDPLSHEQVRQSSLEWHCRAKENNERRASAI